MKALLIYFSQTGNTRKIAERISAGITTAGAQCDLKPLAEVGRGWRYCDGALRRIMRWIVYPMTIN